MGVDSGEIEPILEPTELDNGNINWDCGPGATTETNVKYLPATCKDS